MDNDWHYQLLVDAINAAYDCMPIVSQYNDLTEREETAMGATSPPSLYVGGCDSLREVASKLE